MGFLGWTALAGTVFLVLAFTSTHVQRLPLSTSILYLGLGVALGPSGFRVLDLDVVRDAAWLESLTEIAVITSLFIGGLKLRLPLRDPAWRAPLRLAGPVMLVSIGAVALFAHAVFGFAPPMAILLGAILAPTDPVLAGAVSVSHAADKNRMRYALSGEAGLNDGLAFPFVVLALTLLQGARPNGWLAGWAIHRLLWAVPAGLGLGFALGHYLGRLAIHLRSRSRDPRTPSDFLALALIALAYVGAELIHAWGFLAVFAAGVGLRRAEVVVVKATPHPDHDGGRHPPAEHLVAMVESSERMGEPAVAAGAIVAETLSFGDTLERLLEVLLVVLVGAGLRTHGLGAGVLLAVVLMVVIRPIATLVFLAWSPVPVIERPLVGWFGLRGVGSLYYLTYAITQGVAGERATQLSELTLIVIASSIVVHGISAQPLLDALSRLRRASRARLRPRTES